MSSIFKAYDIRGIYPSGINEDLVYRVGRALVRTTGAKSVAIARDHRASSPSLFRAIAHGVIDEGGQVYDLGHADTPMLYFASAKLPVDAAVMITASHNPPEYNGIKLCKKNAVPIGLASGLDRIRDEALALPPTERNLSTHPHVRNTDIRDAYFAFLSSFASWGDKHFHIATDTANAMGIMELPLFHRLKNVTIVQGLHTNLGAPCSHAADPLRSETLIELQHAVRSSRADFGVAYDGDGDRIGFVDDLGHVVPPDMITAILARVILEEYPKATILYDVRCSRTVPEEISTLGGTPIETKVGHANIKHVMKEMVAMFTGEHSAHYYFNEGGYIAEMGSLPAIFLMNLLAKDGRRLSEIVKEIRKYHHSGEINFHTKDAYHLFEELRVRYGNAKISTLDGLKFDFPDWWFSVRSSNTEPVVRLVLETSSAGELEIRRQELVRFIERFS